LTWVIEKKYWRDAFTAPTNTTLSIEPRARVKNLDVNAGSVDAFASLALPVSQYINSAILD
jgi:hypothetical protein